MLSFYAHYFVISGCQLAALMYQPCFVHWNFLPCHDFNFIRQINHFIFSSLDDDTPITSLPCQWKPPKKRKESTLPIAQAQFEKQTYGKTKMRKLALLNDFDPWPVQYRGTAKNNLLTLLEKISGRHQPIMLLILPIMLCCSAHNFCLLCS